MREWSGIGSENPQLTEEGDWLDAAALNDHGKRFTTIARLIEQAQKKKLI